MKGNTVDYLCGIISGFVIGALVVGEIVGCATREGWKSDAIEHNAAHYDTKTGEFKWNDTKEPTR